jgi:rSAM/selenodomain-associated transferase 1
MAKTRLIPALGADGAAEVHRRLAERAVSAARDSGLAFDVRMAGGTPAGFKDWLGGLTVVDQGEGDLGARMLRALAPGPAMIVGSDIPDLAPEHLVEAARLLGRHEVVLGPAHDGGYWLIGMREPLPRLFEEVEWGREGVLARTLANAAKLGIEPVLAATLHDLDRPEDLVRWPALIA